MDFPGVLTHGTNPLLGRDSCLYNTLLMGAANPLG